MDEILQIYGPFNNFQELPPMQAPVSFSPSYGVGCSSQQPPIMLEDMMNLSSQNQNMVGTEGWQRIRWTDEMVKILITAVSYYENVVSVELDLLTSPAKGKWRFVSSTLVERGFVVSPQQCEDKFNDLNKKYKRLIQILGTDTSYNVVENPTLMEGLNISTDSKEEVRKILTCKQLFFREMHSYHSKNDIPVFEDTDVTELTELIITRTSLQLEEKRLEIKMKMLNLEKNKFEWLKSCRQQDEDLQQMMLDNKLMQLENERQAFLLKCRKRGINPTNY